MIVCGVELTGSDAVVCLLNMDRGQFNLPECKVRKLSLPMRGTCRVSVADGLVCNFPAPQADQVPAACSTAASIFSMA
ncbi:Protein of unknown function (DUF3010) [Marinobacter subterrani]|uniref:Uncharacterized protein n=1 Tax=Marinobacter subterrani TaxID=1658765 RepID=A0A0J7JDW0_9GAMM|nr:Protein of unknown function (DUF3010) [Marinobacter subterrani]